MTPFSSTEFLLILPEIILSVGAMILLLGAAFFKKNPTTYNSVLSIAILCATLISVSFFSNGQRIMFNGLVESNNFISFSKGLILVSAILSLLMIFQHLERYALARPELPLLMVFSVLGMMVMVSANDLMSLFLGMEIQGMSTYVLAAFHRNDTRSNEAAVKYFILGALSSAIILYGFSLIYGFCGTTNFDGLNNVLRSFEGNNISLPLQFGVILILCGSAFKISAGPFHMWAPDVYEGVPTPVTAFFAAVPKLAALCVLVRLFMGPFAHIIPIIQVPLVILAFLSIFVGGIAAIRQENIKRLLAYSSMGHVGFMLLGLVPQNNIGLQGMLLYMLIYMLTTVAFFSCLISLKREGRPVENISDFSGLFHQHPLMSIIVAGLMLSMAGIPPLAGFFGKFFIIMGLANGGHITIAVIAILGSVISAYYYIRIIKVIYFEKNQEVPKSLSQSKSGMGPVQVLQMPLTKFVLVSTVIVVILVSIFPKYFYELTLVPVSVLTMH